MLPSDTPAASTGSALSGVTVASPADTPAKRAPSNFMQRMITSLTLLPIVLGATLAGGWAFALLAGLVGLVGLLEFYALARDRDVVVPVAPGVILFMGIMAAAFFADLRALAISTAIAVPLTAVLLLSQRPLLGQRPLLSQRRDRAVAWPKLGHTAIMLLAGVLYLGVPVGLLIVLRGGTDGLLWIMVVYAITWGNDTFAYFGGKLWGRRPLIPRISPKKTVEGAVVGWSAGMTAALIMFGVNGQLSPAAIGLCAIGPGVAILGDLVESMLKRFFHVKDSHLRGLDLFPGHGGVLDRTDSLILVVTLCYGYAIITGMR